MSATDSLNNTTPYTYNATGRQTKVTYADGITAEVLSVTLETPVTIYNFEVADWHNYYVGDSGVLVHNEGCGGSGTGGKRTYYQATSKEAAQTLVNSDNPTLGGIEFREVYVWSEQPTLAQAKNSGARSYETVIQFETSASFVPDTTMDDTALHNIAKVSSRPGPISISNVIEVGFKKEKRWWQFWKK